MANGNTTLQRVNGSHSAKWAAIGVTLLVALGGAFYTAVRVEALAETNAKDITEIRTVELPVIRSIITPRGELSVQFEAIKTDIQELRDEMRNSNREVLRALRTRRDDNG